MTRWQRLIAAALMGIFFVQAVTAVPQLSLTADEPVYMGAGYAFLRSGDLRMAISTQHPPLMQEFAALPLLLQPGPEVETLEGWHTAEMARYAPAFVAWYGDALDAATFAARLPVVWIALLWAAFLFRWAADWFGPWGGLVALTLFTFDPNIMAHSTLATNDVGFGAFSFIAIFAAMRFLRKSSAHAHEQGQREQARGLRRPYWRYLILTGVALGGSLSAKSSGFFTALALVALFLLLALTGGEGRARRVGRAVLQLVFVVAIGLLVLWATYGFEFRPVAGGRLPVPMATQWDVWREMREHLAAGHTSYLMGQIHDTGGLAYYPLAFVLKTPPFTLALGALGLVAAVGGGPRRWQAMLPLWVYLGGYIAATLLSSVSTGYRFLLPVLGLVFLLIAGLFRDGVPWLRTSTWRWGSWAALALLSVVVAVRTHPHFLTYFNFLAGGPAGGHRYLVDSNLDWGQSFRALRAYLDERGIEQVWLSYYTYTDPALYGIRYQPIAPSSGAPPILPARFNPSPGVYAIGATTLHGVMVVDSDMYSWFRQREPVARAGNAIFVYEVAEPNPEPTWLAQCAIPVAPLSPDVVAEGFGREDLRLAYFDCDQSWLYPAGGALPGWYVVRRETTPKGDPFIEERLGGARLSYEQRTDRTLPAFAIYEQPVAPIEAGCSADLQPMDGPLDFLGYMAPETPVRPGATVEIATCWQVTALPERPLSLMLHLAGPEGTSVVVGDGLGVPITSWQLGDVIIQRHQLALSANAPSGDYALYTGAYWLDTLERWPVLANGEPVGDQVVLSPLPVAHAVSK
jgi:hypothetical protein